ncbi:SusD-like starch-binding protein associating with outer membrane [Tenacibaculum adriaticum]|uniref:SusD-like starch-binding protein associating with outer membrane n=1 Tax=Tenacibaculum adriaticum TaxID=413713 RepID=A0A5S5DQ53_9FLAO|nr:SusD/RagB family nutrient-binding outer membrane lipoprotein [Tenacibaculum adriaticum]TYP98027.1 SusD-like starch-binding protein associating with outer membrane [Tenacibaculum adriaticum]
MKKIKQIKLIAFSIFISLMCTSCDGDFEETNTNPSAPTEAPADFFLGGILRTNANLINNVGIAGGYAGNWTQHLSKPQYNDGDKYDVSRSSIGSLWNAFYLNINKIDDMQDLAIVEGNTNLVAVCKILKAHNFQAITDAWGYAPYTEAIKGKNGSFYPKYDSPSTIYNELVKELTEASDMINVNGSIEASQDFIYGGDLSKWKQFANSLLVRVIVRGQGLPDFDHTDLLPSLLNNVFASNSDEAKLKYLSSTPNANPYFEGIVELSREGEWAVGEKLVHMLDGTDLGFYDKRLEVYAKKNGDGEYVGLPPGLNEPGVDFPLEASQIGTEYVKAEAYAYFMTYSQLQFLLAEAAEKGWINTSAAEHYKNGIVSSFASNGLSIGLYPTSYSGGTDGLKQIAQQEYIALFMQPLEGWAEWRRTGVPALTPAINGVIDEVPSRFLYPTDEESLNATNYNEAVAAQGADLLTTSIR